MGVGPQGRVLRPVWRFWAGRATGSGTLARFCNKTAALGSGFRASVLSRRVRPSVPSTHCPIRPIVRAYSGTNRRHNRIFKNVNSSDGQRLNCS